MYLEQLLLKLIGKRKPLNSFRVLDSTFRQNYFQSYCLRSGGGVCGEGTQIWNGIYICRALFKNGGLKERPLTENAGRGLLSERPLNGKTGDLGVKNNKETYIFLKRRSFRSAQVRKNNNTELYIFEKGVFWSGLRRNSRVAKSEKWGGVEGGAGGLSRGAYPYCPYMGVPPPPHSPGLGFCNFKLENEFRTNFNPILTKCWVKIR